MVDPQASRPRTRVVCVIPAYRAAATIASVVLGVLQHVDLVIVVDDACPQNTGAVTQAAFAANPAVEVVFRASNGGVGAAMKTGLARALEVDADIIIKLDADGQMDPSFIPLMTRFFNRDATLAYIKGNRFFDVRVLHKMPVGRLWGNAILSLLTKFTAGYWNIIDPTNGYVAFNARVLRMLPWQSFSDSYFFEISVLSELGLRRLPIVELEMPTIYTSAPSSLSIARIILDFPPKLARLFIRRLVVQYFVFDLNLGTLCGLSGLLLMLFGFGFGAYEWWLGFVTHIPRATGIIVMAMLPFLIGFQLLLNALMYDVQMSQKTDHQFLAALETIAKNGPL